MMVFKAPIRLFGFIVTSMLLSAMYAGALHAASESTLKTKVKAAYIYNFTKFVTAPK